MMDDPPAAAGGSLVSAPVADSGYRAGLLNVTPGGGGSGGSAPRFGDPGSPGGFGGQCWESTAKTSVVPPELELMSTWSPTWRSESFADWKLRWTVASAGTVSVGVA